MNKIVIITAPSGAGKTSIVRQLLQKYSHILSFSISATTRSARANEVHGKDYYFMSVAEFENKIQQNEFIEWEMVYEGKYYGTLKSDLQRIWNEQKIPILDIDVKGAIHIQSQFTDNCLSIFIEPPSVDALIERLTSRGTETPENLKTRIDKANYELSFKHQFNEIVVNEKLELATAAVEKLILDFIQ